ncbi:DNA repair protein RecN [Eubacterium oxidoreducens]|uniref:DNA repair protein RecN n=1 Tax=Eubacterium oxidoreducens TaxID=1732 RepID=A0A1G6AJX1_EUBOX|nr:DNA repair protein RecN [Eubacterium oxidoreducens]SDB08711.1 DNA repair protein RecN (Recombination protein N) [Eubacterium oxidoreducens]
MLINLHIKNIALIEEADIDFYEGLNILTGETGAGKSILIGSMNLALGEKIPREMIRDEAEPALVELVFQVDDRSVLKQLERLEVEVEEGCVILSRRISGGRGIAKINGETVPLAKLRSIAQLLINIHGQHEHEVLLHKKKHLSILDDFATGDFGNLKLELADCYKQYKKAKKKLEDFSLDEEGRKRQLSFLEYEIAEITNAGLLEGEDEELETAYKKMLNSKKLMDAVSIAYECTSGASNNASEQIARAIKELSFVQDYDEELKTICNQLGEVSNLLNDFNYTLRDYQGELAFSEQDFYETEKRLDEINHLKSKYGDSYKMIMESLATKKEQADKLRNYELEKDAAVQELDDITATLHDNCNRVSELRKQKASEFETKMIEALCDLNFLDVRFKVEFEKLDYYTQEGFDQIEFMIATNPGEELKPLAKIASGGELSRIMLAIKQLLAGVERPLTLIFDEIDTGISGRTAQMVSEKLKQIAKTHQVICITHLPQIASRADAHFLIEKQIKNANTLTQITPLSEEESVMELARMLGGAKITDTVISNAREMKALAK